MLGLFLSIEINKIPGGKPSRNHTIEAGLDFHPCIFAVRFQFTRNRDKREMTYQTFKFQFPAAIVFDIFLEHSDEGNSTLVGIVDGWGLSEIFFEDLLNNQTRRERWQETYCESL
jgi:hypothetical protein